MYHLKRLLIGLVIIITLGLVAVLLVSVLAGVMWTFINYPFWAGGALVLLAAHAITEDIV